MKRLALFGSTGSIGTSCLDVVAAHSERLTPRVLTAHRRVKELNTQCLRFQPPLAVVADPEADLSEWTATSTEVWKGPSALIRAATLPDVDVVVAGLVGAAGLPPTLAAVRAGKRVAIANKETLVVAGPLVMAEAQASGAELLPVDSEHNAVFQALAAGRREDVKQIILTASGGPFRGKSRSQLEHVSIDQALAHPTWRMGPKITIDSATMMNKALEVIEARWLFDLRADQIAVVVHPQSIIHSLVEFTDGSVIAQLSPPDMRLPIQHALSWPERWTGISPTMNWREAAQLTLEPPDFEAFPALELGFEVARRGGTCGAVLNAANEVAVDRFLNGSLAFLEIADACRSILQAHDFDPNPTLETLLGQDRWAREEMRRWKA